MAGRYVAAEYADVERTDEGETANDGSDDDQTTLVGEAAPADGGETDE